MFAVNEVLVPDWIKKEAAQMNAEKARQDADEQRKITLSVLTRADGPKFWKNLHKESALNTDALPKIGLSGDTSNVSSPGQGEEHFRISVNKRGAVPPFTYADLFYLPESGSIRCSTMEGQSSTFYFCVFPVNQSLGIMQDNGVMMDAVQMAAYIVKGLADSIRQR